MKKQWMLAAAIAAVAVAAPVTAQGHGDHGAAGHAAAGTHGHGPAEDIAAVTAVVNTLFDGMRAGDSTMVRSVFHPAVRMVTTFRNQEGQPQVAIENDLTEFVTMIGTPHDEVFDERISGLMIHVDAGLAMAWMNYEFYLGERFSHCGVNLMEMVRTAEGWKIVGLADTRRRAGCEAAAAAN